MARSSAAMSFVNCCEIRTWLLNSITSIASSFRMRRTKPVAASCAVERCSSMLLLVSSRIARAIGCWIREKKVMVCFAPSSNTSNASWSRPVTYFAPSMTVTFSDTSSTPARNRPCCCAARVAAAKKHAQAAASAARRPRLNGPPSASAPGRSRRGV
jgi:hypothetical protein